MRRPGPAWYRVKRPSTEDDVAALGELLVSERKRRGLSQKDAAALVGAGEGQGTWSRWELGSRLPEMGYVPALAKFLRMDQANLIAQINDERLKASTREQERERLIRIRNLATTLADAITEQFPPP